MHEIRSDRVKLQSGATRMVEALDSAGVRCVFGLPGTQTIELFEVLRQRDIRTVIATSESSAAFMAGGWARVTGKPGVLVTISGPGFTWTLSGIAEARLDSIPLVHIVGSPPVDPLPRMFRQQELPQTEIARPLYKSIIDADSYADLAEPINEAIARATADVPGPVLVQVTSMALQLQRSLPEQVVADAASPSSAQGDISGIVDRVKTARRPVFLVGPGVIPSAVSLLKLAERIRLPIITTPSARGVVSETHPLNLGFDPFAGCVTDLNEFLRSADVILAVGTKLSHSDTSGFEMQLPSDRLVHLARGSQALEANYPASVSAVGDAGVLIDRLLAENLRVSDWSDVELADWRRRISNRTGGVEPRIGGSASGNAQAFFASLRQGLSDDAILVLDSGLHQILARAYFPVKSPHGMLMPTDLQSMGFAIPTAIGAKLASPERAVIAVVGDGGFAMTALELLSAARESMSIVVVVFADGAFGQIRMQQLSNYGAAHAVTLRNPDFGLLAASVGAHHDFVGDNDDIELCVRDAVRRRVSTIIEVSVRDSLPIRREAATARVKRTLRRTGWARFLLLFGRLVLRR